MILAYIILLTLIGGLFSLIGSILIAINSKWSESFSLKLVSFSAGVLLSTATHDLLPEAVARASSPQQVFMPFLVGILMMFFMERFLLIFHHHHTDIHDIKPSVYLSLFGDTIHNFIDGIAMASSFLLSPAIGIVTTIAIAAHEIPQEISDFLVGISGGLTKKKAILLHALSSLASVLGGVATFYLFSVIQPYIFMVISFTAGTFLYIACADIIPEIHRLEARRTNVPQSIMFLLGISIVFVVKEFVGKFLG